MGTVLLTGCRVTQYGFVQQKSVHILSPRADSVVTVPLKVTWSAPGVHLGTPGGPATYAVFVDRNPMQPGQGLKSLCTPNDTQCLNTPGEPDAAYLAQQQVYLTKSNSLVLQNLPLNQVPSDLHNVTIVLLNAQGRRLGEANYSVEFASSASTL